MDKLPMREKDKQLSPRRKVLDIAAKLLSGAASALLSHLGSIFPFVST